VARLSPANNTELDMTTATATQFEVTIIYNGLPKAVTANSYQAVQALLQQALNAFEIHQGRENLALFTEAGQLLDPNLSVKDAGVTPESKLLLRPRQVSGGV